MSEATGRTSLEPCHCGSPVSIFATDGGRGSNETTSYAVHCPACGQVMAHLPGNGSGRRRDAAAEWNRERRKTTMGWRERGTPTKPQAPRGTHAMTKTQPREIEGGNGEHLLASRWYGDMLEKARAVHGTQVDRRGVPYWKHLDAVARRLVALFPCAGQDEVAAALFHDAAEDRGISGAGLLSLGLSTRSAIIVLTISRHSGFTKPARDYLAWVRAIVRTNDRSAMMVKLADNLENSDPSRPHPDSERMNAERYFPARNILERGLAALGRSAASAGIERTLEQEDRMGLAGRWTATCDRIPLAISGHGRLTLTCDYGDRWPRIGRFTSEGGVGRWEIIDGARNRWVSCAAPDAWMKLRPPPAMPSSPMDYVRARYDKIRPWTHHDETNATDFLIAGPDGELHGLGAYDPASRLWSRIDNVTGRMDEPARYSPSFVAPLPAVPAAEASALVGSHGLGANNSIDVAVGGGDGFFTAWIDGDMSTREWGATASEAIGNLVRCQGSLMRISVIQ